MKNKKWVLFLSLFLWISFFAITFAQEQPPEITEKQVFLDTSSLNQTILANLTSCGLVVSYTDPINVEYMPNPQINWSSPNTITLSAEKFVNSPGAQEVIYNNFSVSGTISIGNNGISFSQSSVQPSNVENCISSSMVSSISSSLTFSITPSQYNTYDENLSNLKCGEIQGSKLMLVYDSKGASNVVPSPYEFCAPTSQGGMLQYGMGGYSGGDKGGNNGDNNNIDISVTNNPISFSFQNPLGTSGPQTIPAFIQLILIGIIKISLPIIALAIIYSGFLFISARGRPDELTKAKKALTYTLIGATLLLGAWALAQLISDTVLQIK